jgi:hypothetical protein
MPAVSEELGRNLGRSAMVVALTRLREELQDRLDRYRPRRAPEDETLFDYVLTLADDENNWHTLPFTVDDTTAPDRLLVVALTHRPGKFLG